MNNRTSILLTFMLVLLLSGCDGGGIIVGIIILAIIGFIGKSVDDEKIITCSYCKRRIKKKNLNDGMCPFCGNQIE